MSVFGRHCYSIGPYMVKPLFISSKHFSEQFYSTGANYFYLLYPLSAYSYAGLFVKYIVKTISATVLRKCYMPFLNAKPQSLYVHLYHRQFYYHRFWGISRASTYRAWVLYWFKFRAFSNRSTKSYAFSGCGAAGAIIKFSSAYSRYFVCHRSALARPHHVVHLPLLVTSVTATTIAYFTGMDAMFAFS